MVVILLVGCFALLILCLLLHGAGTKLREELFQARTRTQSLDRESESLRRLSGELRQNLAVMEQEQLFMARFIRELPHLTRELHSRTKARKIPEVLLRIVMRSFEPRQALVLLRRRDDTKLGDRAFKLVVAAVEPPNGPLKPGVEIPVGRGKLGFVAEVQRVMATNDFEHEIRLNRDRLKQSSLPEPDWDLVAPMVYDEDTVGVIALSRPGQNPPYAKEILRLIAQIGADSMHNVAVYSRVKQDANVDGLTGAYNKRHMVHALGELLLKAQEKGGRLSLFLFDVDNFKNYNDVNGHLAGDQLLKSLAALVRENIREEDIFGRFGGEEFLLVLPGAGAQQAQAVAEKIRLRIAQRDFAFAEQQPLGVVSVSGGVSAYPGDGLDSTSLIRAADQALYQAKRQGRNRVLLAGPEYGAGQELVVDRDLFGDLESEPTDESAEAGEPAYEPLRKSWR